MNFALAFVSSDGLIHGRLRQGAALNPMARVALLGHRVVAHLPHVRMHQQGVHNALLEQGLMRAPTQIKNSAKLQLDSSVHFP